MRSTERVSWCFLILTGGGGAWLIRSQLTDCASFLTSFSIYLSCKWVGDLKKKTKQLAVWHGSCVGRVVIPTSWDQMWACRCSGSLRKINPFRRLHSISASVLTSETMKSQILIWRRLFLFGCVLKHTHADCALYHIYMSSLAFLCCLKPPKTFK